MDEALTYLITEVAPETRYNALAKIAYEKLAGHSTVQRDRGREQDWREEGRGSGRAMES